MAGCHDVGLRHRAVSVDEAVMVDDLGRHFSNSLVRLLLETTERRLGSEALARVLEQAGERRAVAELYEDAGWSSYDQFVALLRAASEAMGGIESLESIHADIALGGATGSTAEIVATVQKLGSPMQLIRSMGVSNQFTMMEFVNTELHASAYQTCFRTTNGFELTPELSAYLRGIIPLGVRVFGFDDIAVEPATCDEHGDAWCSVRVSWDDTRDSEFLLEEARLYRDVAEKRLETFHDTIAEVVSAEDLDVVLDRVVNAILVFEEEGRVRYFEGNFETYFEVRKAENVAAAQRAFLHRARMNSLAAAGRWTPDLEKAA